jgi:hypothetical protein
MTEKRTTGAGMLRYLREAFTFRWNLLLLAAGVGGAALSGRADVALPLVAAAEIVYLMGVTGIPRFRSAIDARVHAERQPQRSTEAQEQAQQRLARILGTLPLESHARFDALKARCREMQRLAAGVRAQAESPERQGSPALDRLLWQFVRLLLVQHSNRSFLAATSAGAILEQLEALREKERSARERQDERLIRSLVDSIATAELRLENYRKAESNAEYVDAELVRVETKIQALVEMSVSHEDPDFLTSQVDSIAESMVHTENTLRELSAITGLTEELDLAPAILEAEPDATTEG